MLQKNPLFLKESSYAIIVTILNKEKRNILHKHQPISNFNAFHEPNFLMILNEVYELIRNGHMEKDALFPLSN
jgi:hypothetical protein